MHDIEPFFKWRDNYVASEDKRSPFYGRAYSEFQFSEKIYNYYIHPQWDNFGSDTLYIKILFADYEEGFAVLELIGEWNDTIGNDVMFLKRDLIDPMVDTGIFRFILLNDNVLNFHGSDDCYYEEWYDDIKEEDGWICILNTLKHVHEEMNETQLGYFVNFGEHFNDIDWRLMTPKLLYLKVNILINGEVKKLT